MPRPTTLRSGPTHEPLPPPRNVPSPFCMEDSIGFLISRVKALMVAGMDARMQAQGMTAAQWAILMRIAYGGARTAADLCREMGYDTGSMTRILSRLQDKQLLQRQRSHEDKRVFVLSLTASGRALFPALAECGRDLMNGLLRDFSDAEQAQLRSFLRRMVDNAARLEGAGQAPDGDA